MTKKHVVLAVLLLCTGALAQAQVADAGFGYRFGDGKGYGTSVISAFAEDPCGDTYARADFGFSTAPWALSSSYLEVSRTLCFWKDTALKGLGIHGEFNGHLNKGNSNWLVGLDYTIPGRNMLKFSASYMFFNGSASSMVPAQFSFLWRCNDVLDVPGLQFRGLLRVWGEETAYWYGDEKPTEKPAGHFIVKATPQLWYSIGRLFGFDNLSLGGEVELSYNYLGHSGFRACPMAGVKIGF